MPNKTFTLDDPAFPMHYPGFVFRALRETGLPAAGLLMGTDLTEAHLSDPGFRCGFANLRRLYLNAIEQSRDPHIGLRLALRFEPTFVGLPLYTAMNAGSFEEALRVFSRLVVLTFPALEFTLSRGGEWHSQAECALRIRSRLPLGDIAYFGAGSALVASDALLKAVLRRPDVTLRAEITVEEPNDWNSVAPEIPFPVHFGAGDNRLIFPAELLDSPLPASDPINHRHLLSLCNRLAEQVQFGDTIAHQVLAFLESERNACASLARTAAALGLSERGLRRQLEKTGTSYRWLMEQSRERRAREMLGNTAKPIQAIAFELGFDTPSNFARSFKRWTGASPTAFRNSRISRADNGQN